MRPVCMWRVNATVVEKAKAQIAQLKKTQELLEAQAAQELEAAKLEFSQASEANDAVLTKHSFNTRMITALNNVLQQDQWFTTHAMMAIANWRQEQQIENVLDIMDEEIANKQYELDAALYELESIQEQLAESKQLQRQMAQEGGMDLLLDKVDELEALVQEKTKAAREAELERNKTQEKLQKALEQIRKAKDDRPPDVKAIEAANQEKGSLRARGILVAWCNGSLRGIVHGWLAKCQREAFAAKRLNDELAAAIDNEVKTRVDDAVATAVATAVAEAVETEVGKVQVAGKKRLLGLFGTMLVMNVTQRFKSSWLTLLLFRWKLKQSNSHSANKAKKTAEDRLNKQLSLVKQAQESGDAELVSLGQELEAARQSRLKFKGLSMKLKKRLAKVMLMLWMAFDKDMYERDLIKYNKVIDVWYQKWKDAQQSDAKAFLKETAKEKQDALKQRLIAVEKQNEQVMSEMVTMMESTFGALTGGNSRPSADLTLAREASNTAKKKATLAREKSNVAKEQCAKAQEQSHAAQIEMENAREQSKAAREEMQKAQEEMQKAQEEVVAAKEAKEEAKQARLEAQDHRVKAQQQIIQAQKESVEAQKQCVKAKEEQVAAISTVDRAQKELEAAVASGDAVKVEKAREVVKVAEAKAIEAQEAVKVAETIVADTTAAVQAGEEAVVQAEAAVQAAEETMVQVEEALVQAHEAVQEVEEAVQVAQAAAKEAEEAVQEAEEAVQEAGEAVQEAEALVEKAEAEAVEAKAAESAAVEHEFQTERAEESKQGGGFDAATILAAAKAGDLGKLHQMLEEQVDEVQEAVQEQEQKIVSLVHEKEEVIEKAEEAVAKVEEEKKVAVAEIKQVAKEEKKQIITEAVQEKETLVQKHEQQHKLDAGTAQLLVGALVRRQSAAMDRFVDEKQRSTVLLWRARAAGELLASERENLKEVEDSNSKEVASLKERIRSLGQQKMMTEEKCKSLTKKVEAKEALIEALMGDKEGLDAQIPPLLEQIKTLKGQVQRMDVEYLTLSEEYAKTKAWLLARLGASIIRHVNRMQMSNWLRCVRAARVSQLLVYRKSVAPLLMSAYAIENTFCAEQHAWKKRLAIPFLHWHAEVHKDVMDNKLMRSKNECQRKEDENVKLQAQVNKMIQEQEDALAEARQKARDEVTELEDQKQELQEALVKKRQERDIHVRRMTNQHHEILEIKGDLAMERRRRLYAFLIMLREMFKRRVLAVTIHRWQQRQLELSDPESAPNQLILCRDQLKRLAAEVKKMQAADSKLHEGANTTALKIQGLQDEQARLLSRGKRVHCLLAYAVWASQIPWQAYALEQSVAVWKFITKQSGVVKKAAGELQGAEAQISTLDQQKASMEKFLSECQAKMLELQEALSEKEEQASLFETRLFEVKKEAEMETKKLETGFLEAMKAADMNREIAEEKSESLSQTVQAKAKVEDTVDKQKSVIAQKTEAEAKLAEMYDKAMECLQKEQGSSAIFTAAVLKTHWLASKIYGVMKMAKASTDKNKISPENLPMTNGVDVLRIDELMLREVYHWLKKNEQEIHMRHLKAAVAPVEEPPRQAAMPIAAAPHNKPAKPSTPPVALPLPPPEPIKTPTRTETPEQPQPGPFKLPEGAFVMPEGDLFEATQVEEAVSPSRPKGTIRTVDQWVNQTNKEETNKPATPTFEGNKFSPLPPINE